MLLFKLGKKDMSSNFGIVGFAYADVMYRLGRYACRLKELRSEGVRGGDIRCKSTTFIKPVGLTKFPNQVFTIGNNTEYFFRNITNANPELSSGRPVNLKKSFKVKGIGLRPFELSEIEFISTENTSVDRLLVCPEFLPLSKCQRNWPSAQELHDKHVGSYQGLDQPYEKSFWEYASLDSRNSW